MSKVKSYLSLIKFSHTIFAMPFALIGFFVALIKIDYATSVVPGWHTKIYPPSWLKDDNSIGFSKDSLLGKIFVLLMKTHKKMHGCNWLFILSLSFFA